MFRCEVKFDGYDWKNEFTVKSPTGKQITLACNGKWDDMSEELLTLVYKYKDGNEKDIPWNSFQYEDLSREIMEEVKQLAESK